MVLNVISYGNILNFEYNFFDQEESKIVLKENQNPNSLIEVQYVLPIDRTFEKKLFNVYFLIKSNLKENDIFQVFDRERSKRIGWCIPINALDSKDHDYANDEHFLRYAYVAVKEAIKQLPDDIFTKDIDISTSDKIRVSDIFHESTALLVISQETLGENGSFDLSKALPSLIKFGYVRLTGSNPDLLNLNKATPSENKIYVEFISDQIDSSNLIPVLLENVAFCQTENIVLRFFYLYQVIELLLECVFKNEQNLLVQDLLNCKDDSSKTKEVLEKVQRNISEKKRINLLVNDYCSISSNFDSIKKSCNELLVEIGKKEGNEFEDYFYSIRNFIFHQFRNFPTAKNSLLEAVIDDFIDVLPSILSSFRFPPTT